MRLALDHSPQARAQIAALQERDGYVSDISLALRYRPELFGQPFSALLQEVMKSPSDWTEGERELFAAFVSAQNQCPF
ncbi:MAG: carboxymuconolactone decarboxylase family protein [Gaiellaceae bacterium]